MKLRNRIVGLENIKAADLAPHPKNWRSHPREQRDALRGVLAEIGIADALLVRKANGGYQILDGHCRAEETPDTEWPCLVVDLTDAEAEKLLATHDPLAAMAEADADALKALLAGVETENEAVARMLEALAGEAEAITLDIGAENFGEEFEPQGDIVGLHFALERQKAAQVIEALRRQAGDGATGPAVDWQSRALYELVTQ